MGQGNDVPRGESNSAIPRKATVLLVHEDPGDLHDCGVTLQELGYPVRGCKWYEEGADLLGSEAVDFIIVSQGSPSFEGRLVLEHAVKVDRNLPVLVVARCLDMGCYLQAMQLGAVDYLVEPLTGSEIDRVLANVPRVHSMAA